MYSGEQLLAEYNDATSALLKRYVYALGKDDPIMAIDASNNVTYLHADHLGSIIAQTNSSGVIVNKYQYSPHGQSVSLSGTTFGFTGQRFDSDLGLYHYKARYYSPALCRFLQTDPAGYEVGYNLYPYASNDPLNLVDSYGAYPEPTQVQSAFDKAGPLIQQQLDLLEIAITALATAGGSLVAELGVATAKGVSGVSRFKRTFDAADKSKDFFVGADKSLKGVKANRAAGLNGEVIESFRPAQKGATKQVTFEDPTTGTQARVDLFKKSGGTEVKTGNAVLSDNQKLVYPLIEAGLAVPVGARAVAAGLRVGISLVAQGIPGVPIKISRYLRR